MVAIVSLLAASDAAAGARDPMAEANAGLDALKSGNDPEAVRLFTDALVSGRLSRADRELAYVKRAEAHAHAGEIAAALGDVKRALALSPADKEAQDLLANLESASGPAAAPAPAIAHGPAVRGMCTISVSHLISDSQVGQYVQARLRQIAQQPSSEPQVGQQNLLQREMKATQEKATNRIAQELDPIAQQLYEQNHCSILINHTSVLIGNPAMDLTQAAMTALNEKIQQFSFEREHLDDAPASR